MRFTRSTFSCVALLFFSLSCLAQDKLSFKTGRISLADFQQSKIQADSNAGAVILADIGSTVFEGNKKGWFTLIFKRRTRIQILRKSAMGIATFKIQLYRNKKDQEVLDAIEAITFNENNGKIAATELNGKDVFEEKLDKYHTIKSFSMPAVKEGSIIDVAYTIKSDFLFNLQPWAFQHMSYPCLWSEYEINVPVVVNYIFLKQGYNKFFSETRDERRKNYRIFIPHDFQKIGSIDRTISMNAVTIKNRWIMKNLPALQEADHLSTPLNYLDRIEFQLAQVAERDTLRDVMDTWPKVTAELKDDDDFAGVLAQDNIWLDKDVQAVTRQGEDQLSVSKNIYEFVKKNYACTETGYHVRTKLQDVFKSRKGNVGEINLILTAMLRKKGIIADPVLASTRNNGRPYEKYPLISKYNYAFCRIIINDTSYCLDASRPLLGFGMLDPECYNGIARVINDDAHQINLSPDSLRETQKTMVTVLNSGNDLKARVKKNYGYGESYHLRETLIKNGVSTFRENIEGHIPFESQVENLSIDSLSMLEKPLSVNYDFVIKNQQSGFIYFNPMFGEGFERNVFKAEERILPVELSSVIDNTYELKMEIPKGYTIAEIPESVKFNLNNKDEVVFEYFIEQDNKHIMLRTNLKINRTRFEAKEYNALRDFVDRVIKKQKDNIVFERKSV